MSQSFGLLHLFNTPREQHVLDTNARKELSLVTTGV
jgi:hypothetical protein